MTLAAASRFCTTRPGPTPRTCTSVNSTMSAMATSACGVTARSDGPEAALEQRARVGGGGNESSEVEGKPHGAGGNRARESRDEGRPAGEKRGQRPEGLAQVDVLAAGLRPKRGQLGIGHGARKGDGAAEQPDRHHRPRIAHQPRDDRRREEDAAADDVADDDGGRVERTQAAFED